MNNPNYKYENDKIKNSLAFTNPESIPFIEEVCFCFNMNCPKRVHILVVISQYIIFQIQYLSRLIFQKHYIS